MNKSDFETQLQQRFEAVKLAKEFFSDDLEKVDLWMNTNNLLLGGITPAQTILIGRGHKLLQFMNEALEEDRRNN